MEIITRAEARERGLARYFTGNPCKHGHVAERRISNNSCTICEVERAADWRKNNRDKSRLSSATYRKKNVAKLNLKDQNWRLNNASRVRENQRDWWARKVKSDPVFVASVRVRSLLKASIKNRGYRKNARVEAILGCTFEEFRTHIERQFLPGMTWENRHLWHIDHIVPMATAKTEADVIALNHFTNLRPLWKPDNIAKGAKQTHLL